MYIQSITLMIIELSEEFLRESPNLVIIGDFATIT